MSARTLPRRSLIYGSFYGNKRGVPARYTCLTDGGSGTWLYMRECPDAPGVFVAIEIIDMADACGRDTIGQERWCADVSIVDIPSAPAATIASALKSCGWRLDTDDDTGAPCILCPYNGDTWPATPLAIAEIMHGYGAKAPMWSSYSDGAIVTERNVNDSPGEETRPWQRLRTDARREADALADTEHREAQLDTRIVNALGSTAREFAAGDIASAMQRGCEAGAPNARIMAKMYGVPDATIDDTRPEDWLPYMFGYMRGMAGAPADPDPDLAPEYTRGYARGKRVASGECPAPAWITTNQKGA